MTHERSITLHQQDGGMSVQAFADREGLSLEQAKRFAKRGQILGARQDARSKHWWIYPPAKLLIEPRSRNKRSAAGTAAADCADLEAERDTPRAAPPPGAGVMAAALCGHADAHPMQAATRAAKPPSAKPVLILPEGGNSARSEARTERSAAGLVYRSPEVQSVLCTLREAAARQFREGLHYLRLDAHEFAQLYAALGSDRSRVKKLVGRGLLPVGLLRASDSVWQKLQAMSQQGRLL